MNGSWIFHKLDKYITMHRIMKYYHSHQFISTLSCKHSHLMLCAEGHLNIKIPSHQYRNSHYKDNIVSQLSFHHNENPHTLKKHPYIKTGSMRTLPITTRHTCSTVNWLSNTKTTHCVKTYKKLVLSTQIQLDRIFQQCMSSTAV